MSETWNREELYIEIWEKPLVKVAAKYNISAVALGKVCRKLQIPLPGRGYWTKKEFGKTVEQTPLPTATNLPVVRKMKEEYVNANPAALCGILNHRDASDFLRSNNLILIYEEDVKFGDPEQFINLRQIRPIFTARVSTITTSPDSVSLVTNENFNGVRLSSNETVEKLK